MDKKITQLTNYTTPQTVDVMPIVDVGATTTKKITFANLATNIITYIAGIGGVVQSVTGLNTNNADPANPIVAISVDGSTIGGSGTPIDPLYVIGGAGSGNGTSFDGKTKSFSLEGIVGEPIQNGYQNIEAYINVNGTTVSAELGTNFLQVRNVTTDWVSATQVNSYVINQGFLFLLLQNTGTNAYRVYRYDINDLSLGGTLMTIATQTLGTQDFVTMTSDGTDFFFNYKGGNSANDYVISQYTISGTTITYSADITCGATPNATNVFTVDTSGNIYGLNTAGTREVKKFDGTGTLQDTYGPYNSDYTNITNWTDTMYITKGAGDDEAYRISPSSASSSSSGQMTFVMPANTTNMNVIGNYYSDVDAFIYISGTIVPNTGLLVQAAPGINFARDLTADWAAADQVVSVVLKNNLLYVLLLDNATTARRVYMFDATDDTVAGTLMTFSGGGLGTSGSMSMSYGAGDFYFSFDGGNSANDNEIRKYSLAGTTFTNVNTTTMTGGTGFFSSSFFVASNGHLFGLDTGGNNVVEFDAVGTLLLTTGDNAYQGLNTADLNGNFYSSQSISSFFYFIKVFVAH